MREEHARLLGHLYEGVLQPEAWLSALDSLRAGTDSGVFHHVAWDHRTQCVVSGLANDAPAPAKVREYELHHAPHAPRIPLVMSLSVGGLLLDHHHHFSARDMSRNAIYADWLEPLGYRHTLGMPVYDDGEVREWVCLIRERDQQPFGDAAQQWLHQLMPDLVRASRLRVHMARTAAQAALGLVALDTLPQALAVVSATGRVQHLNPAARRSLAASQVPGSHPELRVRHGCIEASDAAAQAVFQTRIASAAGQRGRAVQGATVRLSRETGSAHGISHVHVLPLAATHVLALACHAQPYALLVWAANADAVLHAEQLAMLLGLTDTEARLALALARGQSVKDFAAAQGCTWHTARTHSRNLLRKTGLHRQADLAGLVQSLLPL